MKRNRVMLWTGVLLGLLAAGGGVGALLLAQGQAAAAMGVGLASLGLALLWITYGVIRGWEYRSIKIAAGVFYATLVVGGVAAALFRGGHIATAVGVAGIWAMGVLLLMGLALARLLFSGGGPISGVARTFIDEAIRMKVGLIFVIAIILMVPIMPLVLDPAERLHYRIQFFLSWSVGGVGLMLSLMTIFLACGSVCGEIRNRQIYLTMTKPVSRLNYMLGKWLGLCVLNLVLAAVAGVGIGAFARILETRSARDMTDRLAVGDQVLIARGAVPAQYPPGMSFEEQFNARLQALRDEQRPEFMGPLTPATRQQVEQAVRAQWFTIPPTQSQTYYYPDVDQAKDYSEVVQLRLRPRVLPTPADDKVFMRVWVNGRPFNYQNGAHYPVVVKVHAYHVLDIPLDVVEPGQGLTVRIANEGRPPGSPVTQASITFEDTDAMEVLYRVGGFEGNLARSMMLVWLRLCYLAMLGIAAGTFLGFPVASLLTMVCFVLATGGNYVRDAIEVTSTVTAWDVQKMDAVEQGMALFGEVWKPLSGGELSKALSGFVQLLSRVALLLAPSFSEYSPTALLSDGRLVPWSLVGKGALWLGVIWTCAIGALGWVIFQRRQVASATT